MKARISQNESKTISYDYDRSIVLSVGMIVKNEEKMLEACLEGLKPLLDALPSELVIVDTGSTDKTIEIAKRYTDKIFHFDWVNDFSAARNFGLEKCTGQWFMFLDADDHFADVGDMIEFFNNERIHKNYNNAYYITRNYTTMSFDEYFSFRAHRIARRTADLRFEGAIHEYFINFYQPAYYFESYAWHYGYAFESGEAYKEKAKRNYILLEKELAKDPDDLRTINHIIPTMVDMDDERRALIERALTLAGNSDDPVAFSIYFIAHKLYSEEGENQKALDALDSVIKKAKPDNAVLVEAHACKAEFLFNLGQYAEAEESCKNYLEYYKKYEDGKLEKSALGFVTSNFVIPENRDKMKTLYEFCADITELTNALNNNTDLSGFIERMNFELMTGYVAKTAEKNKDFPSLVLNYQNSDFFFLTIKNLLFGTLLYGAACARKLEDGQKSEIYMRYVSYSSLYVCNIYNPDLLNDAEISALPETHRFGYFMSAAQRELDAGNRLGYVKELKKALDSCKSMQNIIKFLIDEFSAAL